MIRNHELENTTLLNKRTICLFFQVHQPFRLRTYRFFNIGDNHFYFDESENKGILTLLAHNIYIPANQAIKNLIREYGSDFRMTFGISGTALEQFKKYTPLVIESFRRLYKTGNIEFVAESNAYSLAMLGSPQEYFRQVEENSLGLKKKFACQPTALFNTNMLCSNKTKRLVSKIGFKTKFTKNTKEVLGRKSEIDWYSSNFHPVIKIMANNFQQSDSIALHFSAINEQERSVSAAKFVSCLNALDPNKEIVNLFMEYETLDGAKNSSTWIFNFLNSIIGKIIRSGKWKFKTMSEATETIEQVSENNIPGVYSWSDDDHDLSLLLGNKIQQQAFETLYSVAPIMAHCDDRELVSDWNKLQSCDHFIYMSTKSPKGGELHQFFNPYNSPYEAFINYMNVLSDFLIRAHNYDTLRAKAETETIS